MDIFEEIILEADSLLKEVKNKNEFAEIKAKILGKNSKLSEAMEKLKTRQPEYILLFPHLFYIPRT